MGTAALCLALALVAVPCAPSSLRRWDAALQCRADRPAVSVVAFDAHAAATTFDLLAACLQAGLPTGTAAAAVATTAPPKIAGALRTTADLLSLGADPESAWTPVSAVPEIESLARMARRSARSGASLAEAISELADSERKRAEDTAAAAAERAGVMISGPLGLCFLPAFVCLGIVPVVAGLAGNVLGGGLL